MTRLPSTFLDTGSPSPVARVSGSKVCSSGSCLAESCLSSLERGSVRSTKQRCAIVRHIFASKPHHFSAEQLHDKIRQENHKISLATVYNTLGLLTRRGWLKSIIIDKGSTVFDSNVSYHHHLYNIETQELSDIASIPIGELPPLPADVALERVEVVVRVRPRSPSPTPSEQGIYENPRGQK